MATKSNWCREADTCWCWCSIRLALWESRMLRGGLCRHWRDLPPMRMQSCARQGLAGSSWVKWPQRCQPAHIVRIAGYWAGGFTRSGIRLFGAAKCFVNGHGVGLPIPWVMRGDHLSKVAQVLCNLAKRSAAVPAGCVSPDIYRWLSAVYYFCKSTFAAEPARLNTAWWQDSKSRLFDHRWPLANCQQ
jgi:hypothetical protein